MPEKLIHDIRDARTDMVRIQKAGAGTQALLAQTLLAAGTSVVLLAPGQKEFLELRALLGLFSNQAPGKSLQGPWFFLPPMSPALPDPKGWASRWPVLHGLRHASGPVGLLAAVDNLCIKWPTPAAADHAALELSLGEEMAPDMILEQAAAWGFRRQSIVSSWGDMAMRGDILDIFAPGYDFPLRLEFFGDVLEQIRFFDPSTQRSSVNLESAILLPIAPSLLSPESVRAAREHWRHLKTTGQLSSEALQELEAKVEQEDGYIFPGLFHPKAAYLKDYLPRDAVFILSGASELRSRSEEGFADWQAFLARMREEQGRRFLDSLILWPEADTRNTWLGRRQLVFDDLVMGERKEGYDLPEREFLDFGDLFWKPQDQQRPWTTLVQALKEWEKNAHQTVLTFHSERARRKFLALAGQEGVFPSTEYSLEARGLFALVSPLGKGVELTWKGVRILPEDVLQPRQRGRLAATDKSFKGMTRYDDLKPDDLLVHRDYGLARFGGLTRMRVGEVANDYLLLFFDGDDKLYLPVDRLRVVQRFKGPEGVSPSLDNLRGVRWQRAKERARKAIEKIARELVEMYAYRKVAKGYSYGAPNDLYHEFEATFGFEETPDQDEAIRAVLEDMEKTEPMDRLVCGDVGFGKTEVAMRAAFRAVMDGRQAVLLCPTTVLAEQHYLNFKARMQAFPVQVAMLSRFVPRAKQSEVLRQAARGQVDILIGTHRILSKDVEVPNLGLLILDEEQRFGVKHKERLKEFKKNIDVLTLTATPIPRTLQLSLSGIRGLSTIETPPPERKAVETALIERDAGTLASIMKRELEREGQVFWVHNRVKTLPQAVEYVQQLAPDARIAWAHGQMNERDLERAMHAFWHKEVDILVCTAIIESGLDFANANTLVVDNAHMFGLGQLYQLRGRVGRSDRQAHAYFVVPSLDALSDLARKRMRVILDMDYLGAGFQVAMEDLRLRGAGNILGEVQSGQIAKVGLDLYLEMLEQEVQRLKGEPIREEVEPEMNFVFPAHIPEDYIAEPEDRLTYYRALSAAVSEATIADIALEVRDRYGHMPGPLENFLAVLRFKLAVSRVGALRADLFPGKVVISFGEGNRIVSPESVLSWIESRSDWARLMPPDKVELRMKRNGSIPDGLATLAGEIAELVPDPELPAERDSDRDAGEPDTRNDSEEQPLIGEGSA